MMTVTTSVTARRTTQTFFVRQLFGALSMDPRTPAAYSDFSPQSLGGWEQAVGEARAIPYFWFADDALGGAFWMHDYGEDYTWLGGYVMQAFRGPAWETVRALGWQACENALRRDGIRHMFSVVLAHNTPAQIWTEKCCGLTPLGIYHHWTLNQGRWTDGVVFCKNYPHDESMAWVLAEQRAEAVRHLVHAR